MQPILLAISTKMFTDTSVLPFSSNHLSTKKWRSRELGRVGLGHCGGGWGWVEGGLTGVCASASQIGKV